MTDTPQCRNDAGVALVTVMLVLALLMSLAVALTISVNMDTGLRGAFDRTTAGFYAAESGLNIGMGNYRDIFLSFNVPTGSDFDSKRIAVGDRAVSYQINDATVYDALHNPPSITIAPGLLFGGLNAIEYDYIARSSSRLGGNTEAKVNGEFKVGYVPIFQFAAFYKKDLEIAPGADMTLNGRIHTAGDLYLDGNGSTLLISDNPPSITTVQVSAQGNIYRGRKYSSTCESPGTVTVDMLRDKVAPFGRLDPQNLNCNGSATRLVPSSELATWQGSMVSELESISVPSPDITARGNGTYWTRADLRIVLNLTSLWAPAVPLVGPQQFSIEVQDADGTQDLLKTAILRNFMADTAWNADPADSSMPGTRPLFYTDVPITSGAPNNCDCTDSHANGCKNASAACYSPAFSANNRVYGTGTTMTGNPAGTNPNDADYRRGGFYNWREKKWMYLLNVNVHDLLAWNRAQWAINPSYAFFDPGDNTDGGIVLFFSVQGPNSAAVANNYGVRIFGSATLPFANVGADPTGITVATDQAAYVLGEYNSAGTIALGKQPASVIGDSINVLSNAYFSAANPPAQGSPVNDAQSNASLSTRRATTTTINAAFLGGVDDTTVGAGAAGYNGGLENYPRFHEDWGGTTLYYQGSFVSLGTPQHVNGSWCGTGSSCNIYNPPVRIWNYDAQFNNAANLPPLTPRFVYVQQVLFTENFR